MLQVPSTKNSFIEIITNASIIIPPLQRDYAQGRKSEQDKLKEFVTFLKKSLDENKKVNLDFIFGYYEKHNTNTSFIPIDGQQRLTTIFLIHWYTAQHIIDYSLFKGIMLQDGKSKFTYKTRVSSQEFISSIIQNGINEEYVSNSKKLISEIIENCGWFYKPWKEDSTVQSMLNAIDVIHSVFGCSYNLHEYYFKLLNGLISFEFLNPNAIELSDEFYIKMNARGLALSQFENFKADLLDTLQENFPHKKKEFSDKLDSEWSDAIWNWSIRSNNTYDNCFDNVLYFLFQVCFSKSENHISKKNFSLSKNYKELLDVYTFEYISKTLDLIVQLDKHMVDNDAIFFHTYIELFKSKNINHHDKLKVYGLFQYQLEFGIRSENDEEFLDFGRIIDNVLFNINQSQKKKFISDLRTSRYKDLIKFIDELLSEQNPYKALVKMESRNDVINHEINKAKIIVQNPEIKVEVHRLESHEYLKGCLKNFMFLFEDISLVKRKVDIFYKLWDLQTDNDLLLYSALFSFGDYEVDVGGSGLGRVYFGGSFKKWHRVLANTNKESGDQIEVFKKLYEYIDDTELDGILNKLEYVPLPPNNIWRYYFAKYPEILKEHDLFAYNEHNVKIAKLELLTKSILSANHTGYLNRAVVLEIHHRNIELLDVIKSYSSSVNWSYLKIQNSEMVFNGEGWLVNSELKLISDNDMIIEALEDGKYLVNSSKYDLVQLMIAFLKKYFSTKK